MTKAEISEIAPFFIVRDLQLALSFYRDLLGFEVVFEGPSDDPFFGIVRRGGAMILLKDLGMDPIPNRSRAPASSWDAYVEVPDPDALADEFAARGVQFFRPLTVDDDGLRGFEVKDADGYGLFFGRQQE